MSRRVTILVLGALLAGAGVRCKRAAFGGVTTDAGTIDAGARDAGSTDGGTTDGGLPACASLDLPGCRARADCTPDLCFACSCTPTFEGCRRPTDPAFQCPQLGCPQPLCCQTSADCQSIGLGADCAPPDAPFPCGGMCNIDPGDCSQDTDCTTGEICEPIPCSCNAEKRCERGCTGNQDCPTGKLCALGSHPRCMPAPCDGSLPCPIDFTCNGGECARRTCSGDTDCRGFCVSGHCYDALGECRFPAP